MLVMAFFFLACNQAIRPVGRAHKGRFPIASAIRAGQLNVPKGD
jgi:hypothetical protein